MSKRFSKFIQLGIVGIWLCLVVILVYRHYISGVAFSALQSLPENQFKTSEEWFGIYVRNEKIGYIKTSSEKIGGEYRFTQYGETTSPQGDEGPRTTTQLTCLTDLDYRIKSFHFENRTGETTFSSRGELDEDNVLLVFLETEIWPAWITEARGMGIKVALINGRISLRTMRTYRRMRVFFRDVLKTIHHNVGMMTLQYFFC